MKNKMTKKKNNWAPEWPKNLRQHIVQRLALWIPYIDIWTEITSKEFEKKTGITALDPQATNYDAFRMRCARVPKHEIALAHEDWQKEIGEIKWAEDKARIQGLSDLIDKVHKYINDGDFDKDTTGTLAALVGQMRNLYEQIRKEVQIDADRAALSASGTRVLLTNPKNIQLDANYIEELALVYREEMGGLHNMDLAVLTTEELKQLRAKCDTLLMARKNQIVDVDYEIENEIEDKNEK